MTGQELYKKRKQLGLSLDEFAKLIKVSKATLWRWERSKQLKPVVVPAIETALKQ